MGMLIGSHVCESCGQVIKWQAHKADRYREYGLYSVVTYSEKRVMADIKSPDTEEFNIELELTCPHCNHMNRFCYSNDSID